VEDQIIEQGPGYTIAVAYAAHGIVPYSSRDHEEGVNHGFVDLRDLPSGVSSIPEVASSPGMRSILTEVNGRRSPLMTIGCEKGIFHLEGNAALSYQAGGYIDTAFRDPSCNAKDDLVILARELLSRVQLSEQAVVSFEMIVQPLKSFFGLRDCHALMLKPMGYGETDTSAWRAFEIACIGMARAIRKYIDDLDRSAFSQE